jgi:hypothetical protein
VKRIFVSFQTFAGNLGGLAGADQKCQTAATAAALGGTWLAWLSTSTVNAIDRVTSDSPYFLVNKTTKVFNNKANWTTQPLVAISMAEDGSTISGSTVFGVWTGTLAGGTSSGSTNLDWTATSGSGTYGFLNQRDTTWTQAGTFPGPGGAVFRLYCYES